MTTEVYYFSGTGNSLTVAKKLANKLNANLVSIPSLNQKEKIQVTADVVGLVFPVYYATNDCGIPPIIARFVEKLENLNSKYVFSVCTYAGMPGSTIENIKKAIASRQGKLACGFIIQMKNTKLPEHKWQKQSATMEQKINTICEYVAAQRAGKYETRSVIRKIFLSPLRGLEKIVFGYRYRKLSGGAHLPFVELLPLADNSFRVNEKCIGCGVCAKVCPVDNIEIVEGKPKWLHRCETCYACYAWCPNDAIYGDIVAYNDNYRHPQVKHKEMFSKTEN